MTKYFSVIIRTIVVSVFFLSSCATSQNNAEPSKAFQIKEDILYQTSLHYKVQDAELAITEKAVYVLYGEDRAYLNPAYVCQYQNFLQEPIHIDNSVKIVCRENKEIKIHYFYIPDSAERNIVLKNIKDQLLKHTFKKSDDMAHQLSDLQSIGISSPDVCISYKLNNDDNKNDYSTEVYDPTMLMHPDVGPYIIAEPSLLIAMAILMPIETWKEKRREVKLWGNVKPIGSLADFSLVLATIADSKLENKVAYITKPCNAIIEIDSEIGAIDSSSVYAGYRDLSDSFKSIIEIDYFSGEFISDYKNKNAELRFSCLYVLISTDSGHVINFGKILYSHSNPSPLKRISKINNEDKKNMIDDAYREISETIISNLK